MLILTNTYTNDGDSCFTVLKFQSDHLELFLTVAMVCTVFCTVFLCSSSATFSTQPMKQLACML